MLDVFFLYGIKLSWWSTENIIVLWYADKGFYLCHDCRLSLSFGTPTKAITYVMTAVYHCPLLRRQRLLLISWLPFILVLWYADKGYYLCHNCPLSLSFGTPTKAITYVMTAVYPCPLVRRQRLLLMSWLPFILVLWYADKGYYLCHDCRLSLSFGTPTKVITYVMTAVYHCPLVRRQRLLLMSWLPFIIVLWYADKDYYLCHDCRLSLSFGTPTKAITYVMTAVYHCPLVRRQRLLLMSWLPFIIVLWYADKGYYLCHDCRLSLSFGTPTKAITYVMTAVYPCPLVRRQRLLLMSWLPFILVLWYADKGYYLCHDCRLSLSFGTPTKAITYVMTAVYPCPLVRRQRLLLMSWLPFHSIFLSPTHQQQLSFLTISIHNIPELYQNIKMCLTSLSLSHRW